MLRRRRTERDKLAEIAALAEIDRRAEPAVDLVDESDPYGDDRLRLLFTCCHPALPLTGRWP